MLPIFQLLSYLPLQMYRQESHSKVGYILEDTHEMPVIDPDDKYIKEFFK